MYWIKYKLNINKVIAIIKSSADLLEVSKNY